MGLGHSKLILHFIKYLKNALSKPVLSGFYRMLCLYGLICRLTRVGQFKLWWRFFVKSRFFYNLRLITLCPQSHGLPNLLLFNAFCTAILSLFNLRMEIADTLYCSNMFEFIVWYLIAWLVICFVSTDDSQW